MFDGVNIKIMKSGGLLCAVSQMQTARDLGLKVMLGCMVESSLGISYALALSSLGDYFDLDGFLFLKEDPFSLVEEKGGELFFPKSL